LSLSGLLRRSYPARRKCLAGTAGLARLPPARQQRLAKPFSLQFFIDEKVMADADQLEPITSGKVASTAITAPAHGAHGKMLIEESRPWGEPAKSFGWRPGVIKHVCAPLRQGASIYHQLLRRACAKNSKRNFWHTRHHHSIA